MYVLIFLKEYVLRYNTIKKINYVLTLFTSLLYNCLSSWTVYKLILLNNCVFFLALSTEKFLSMWQLMTFLKEGGRTLAIIIFFLTQVSRPPPFSAETICEESPMHYHTQRSRSSAIICPIQDFPSIPLIPGWSV